MEPLFLSFIFLFILTSAQSVNNNNNLDSSPNVQPASSSSPTSYSSYPPGYENENAPSESASHPHSDSSISPSSNSPSESGGYKLAGATSTRKVEGGTSDRDANIKKICDNTDYPDLCITTVAPILRQSIVNIQQVLQVAMKASDQLAKLGFAAVKRASESPATPPKTKKMLQVCLESWDTVLYNYEQAIEAMRVHDSGRMSTMLSAAITDISDCQDTFEGLISPLTGYGERMTKMTSNCLAIVSQLPAAT